MKARKEWLGGEEKGIRGEMTFKKYENDLSQN